MRTLIERFLSEPVFALATVAAVDTYLTAQGVIATGLGLVIGGVIAVVQRQLVTPAHIKTDVTEPALDDPHYEGKSA